MKTQSETVAYRMVKWGWNAASGSYDNEERRIDQLTIKEVRQRVKRLPETTRHLWSVMAVEQDQGIVGSTVGSISAEEFAGDVPLYSSSSE